MGLSKDSVILLEQIRTLDKSRLKEKMGHLDDAAMDHVNTAIAISFGLGTAKEDAAARAMIQRTQFYGQRPAAAVASVGNVSTHNRATAVHDGGNATQVHKQES